MSEIVANTRACRYGGLDLHLGFIKINSTSSLVSASERDTLVLELCELGVILLELASVVAGTDAPGLTYRNFNLAWSRAIGEIQAYPIESSIEPRRKVLYASGSMDMKMVKQR
jgi:hypothetical protein